MKNRKVAIVHYTYPPVIGGVEAVVQAHAQLLAKDNYRVKIISGVGQGERNIEVKTIPQLRTLACLDECLSRELKKGKVPDKFFRLKKEVFSYLQAELKDVDVCIAHNVMTMHFNLPFSCALKEVIEKLSPQVRFYLWCHDCAVINPTYQKDIPHIDKYPWSILGEFIPEAEYITISQLRQRQLSRLFSVNPQHIRVVPAGIDLQSFLGISDPVWRLAWDKGIFSSDITMFFPSRILKRKNYELGIKVVAEMRKRGIRAKFMITAPPDPHNPETVNYFNSLHKLCRDLKVQEEVIFLSDFKKEYNLKLNYKQIKELYSICDALFITSTQEGFGIPLLEAGAQKVPIVCTDIEPLAEVAKDYALKVGLEEDPSQIATKIINYVNDISTYSMFKRVVKNYSWQAIYKSHIKRLVDKDAKNGHY